VCGSTWSSSVPKLSDLVHLARRRLANVEDGEVFTFDCEVEVDERLDADLQGSW